MTAALRRSNHSPCPDLPGLAMPVTICASGAGSLTRSSSRSTPGSFILAPFVGEGERTIFLSGTIHLISSTYPLSEGAPLEADSLTLLQQELDSHTGWMLQLPSDDGR